VIFYAGQRVKLIMPRDPSNFGMEGTFLRYENWAQGAQLKNGINPFDTDCIVVFDGKPFSHQGSWQLAPITHVDVLEEEREAEVA